MAAVVVASVGMLVGEEGALAIAGERGAVLGLERDKRRGRRRRWCGDRVEQAREEGDTRVRRPLWCSDFLFL